MLDLGSAVGYLMLDSSGFTSGFGKAEQSLNAFMDKSNTMGDRLSGLGSAMSNIGGSLTRTLTIPLVGAGTAMGAFSIQFEDAMAKVSTIADTSQVPMEDLEKAILDLSGKTGIAATDIADNVYNAISAGQKTADAVSFVEESTKLAVAGFTSSAASLDVLTTTLNAYGLAAEDVTHVSDVLITTQNLGKTTVDELAQSMGRVIPVANANNISLEQLSASYAILTANGINTAETTTYLKGMFNELGKAGTDVSNILKEQTGKSFQQLLEDGASLGDIVAILDQYAKDTGVSLSDLFSSVEAGTAALTIAGKGADYFNQTLKAMEESTGATDEAFDKMQTTSFNFKKSLNELKNVAIDLGGTLMDTLAPFIDSFTNGVKGFSEFFKGLDDGAKQAIVSFGLVLAAVGPVLLVVGKVVTLVTTLGPLFAALTGPIGLVAAAVVALGVAWSTNFAGIRDATASVFESIQSIISSAWGFIQDIWNSNFLNLQGIVTAWWENLQLYWQMVFDTIAGIFEVFALAFQGDWEGAWDKVKEIASNIWDTVKKIFSNFLNAVVDTLLSIASSLWDAAKTVFNKVKEGFEWVWDEITEWFNRVIEDPVGTVLGIGSSLFDAGKSIFTSLWDGLKSIWEDITDWVSDGIEWIVGKVKFWDDESKKIDRSSTGSKSSGSHAHGLDYVPRTMNVTVHEGERILTKEENKSYGKTVPAKLNVNVNFTEKVDRNTAKKVSREIAYETEKELRGKGVVLV